MNYILRRFERNKYKCQYCLFQYNEFKLFFVKNVSENLLEILKFVFLRNRSRNLLYLK